MEIIMDNQYNEVGATKKFFTLANQTRANILANPHPCRLFIANDTGEIIVFDKDSNPLIFSMAGSESGYLQIGTYYRLNVSGNKLIIEYAADGVTWVEAATLVDPS